MSEVAEIDTTVESKALTPMDMIESALTRGADIETLDKLMTLQERWAASSAKSEYDADMAAMQVDLPVIEKNRTSHNGKYADWGQIKEGIQPALTKHGFAITHRTEAFDGGVTVTAICSHRGGHREETSLPIQLDNSGSKNKVQSLGSSVAYGIRYTGCAILGIATKEATEDDNGSGGWSACERVMAVKNAASEERLLELRDQYKEERNVKQIIGNDEWTAILQAFQEKK